jgi:hypothetical protein
MFIVGHLCKLRSFGNPYFWPIGPMQFSEWKDTLVRYPIWQNMQRPVQLNVQDEAKLSEETHEEIADQGGMKGGKQ